MKECTLLTCNRPSDRWEKAKKSELEKWRKGGVRERERKNLFYYFYFPLPALSLLLSAMGALWVKSIKQSSIVSQIVSSPVVLS